MNWRQRENAEARADELQEEIEELKDEVTEKQEELDGIMLAIGAFDLADLNKQFEADIRKGL